MEEQEETPETSFSRDAIDMSIVYAPLREEVSTFIT
ncbi:hypothetical protein KIPB_013911, partial [Kipferlia bialata]|eukprot:g13911.t1